MTSPVPVTAGTLSAPGVRLYYEVRGSGPLVAFVGAPMHSASFAPIADLLAADHTVLTTDPRGHFGSVLDDPEQDSTPELRAGDLARLIRHLGAGPAVVIGSSGGAITGLALAQADPEVASTVIAHEPPLGELLDGRDERRAATEEMVATYLAGDELGAWRQFIAFTGMELPEEMFQQMFAGEKDPEEHASQRYWFAHELRKTSGWVPDLDALRATPTRLVIGIGDASAGQFCDLTSRTLAAELDLEPTLFPGGHTGFMEDPVKFAERLREVIG
ncbi:alpha/beta fold hydrolase [Nocardia mexicana]|uniref:Pimeloyl-ACP methyl ester carboxylesterase n=1 Tax=Nocardia mexicana TaxID=279262 RepID=A0A370H5G9_9NOCA|nr:alpha/beta hydrolase [Nocardia mexicana]RDI51008.1 pimeloyl-ACP methyl ester carboxylesterase [Nocardia mexicana]